VTRLGFVKMSGPTRKRPASLRQQSACLGWWDVQDQDVEPKRSPVLTGM